MTAWRGGAGAALALLVLGMAWPGRLPGAQVGVELLLVCAGALLGHTLLVRRDRPIGPALTAGLALVLVPLLVLVAAGVAVQRWTDLRDWPALLHDVREAALGTANLGDLAADSPVGSFWLVSLLVQAAVVVLALRWLAGRITGITTVVLLLSVSSFVWWAFDPAAHLGTRFWPVGLGILAALVLARRAWAGPGRALVAWGTAAGVCGVAVTVSGDLLLTVLGAVAGLLLVLSGPAAGSPVVLLGPRLTRWFAAIAWAGFCWAGPALRLAPEAAGRDLGLRDRAELLLVVGAAAAVTVAVVALLRMVVAHGAVWFVLVAGAVVAAVLVTVPGLDRVEAIESDVSRVEDLVTDGLPDCFGAAEIAARNDGDPCDNPDLEGVTDPPVDRIGVDFEPFLPCWSRPHDDEVHVCTLGRAPEDAPRVLVVGDSHARVLFGAFRRLAERGVMTVSATAKASCGWSTHPISDEDEARVASCDAWRANLAAWLEQHATDYDVIVTTAFSGRMVGPKEQRIRGLEQAWAPVVEQGVPIVALRDNPRLHDAPADCLVSTEPDRWSQCDVPRQDVRNHFDAFERAAARTEGVDFVDLWRYFCDDETCPAVIGGVGVYRDNNHVAASYATTLAPFLYREIARTGVFHP